LIQEFVDAGYKRADAEVYFDRLYVRLQHELALYFGREKRPITGKAKAKEASVSDEQLAKATRLFFHDKDLVGALQSLENALRFAPDDARLTLDLALRQQASGQLSQARANFDRAEESYPGIGNVLFRMGNVRLAARDYLGAISDLTTAIYLQPGAVLAYSLRGMARQDLEDYEGAIDDYSMHIASGTQLDQAQIYMRRGFCHFVLGHMEIARADYQAAIRIEPGNYVGHLLLGRLLRNEGQYEAALAAINKSVELQPNNPEPYTARVAVLLNLGEHESALRDAELLMKMAPNDAFYVRTKAMVLDVIERREEAESAYRQAIAFAKRIGDTNSWYYANLQFDMFLRQQGRSESEYLRDVVDWPDDWPKRIALYLTGHVTAESLLNAARLRLGCPDVTTSAKPISTLAWPCGQQVVARRRSLTCARPCISNMLAT
jgi:tetratricopeptide (TPR) repeat protein